MRGSVFLLATASVLSFSGVALAQDAEAQTGSQDETESQADARDIVVTGTLIRGQAPVGSNSIVVGQQRLEETGAQTANQLLASIPQVTNYFNRVPASDLGINVGQLQITRPNLRNISPQTASSSATLILVDGHRIASAGVSQASVDPDILPTGAIARVDVVTEGGSATYGADAVAGVINFITHRRFEGVKVDAHYGFAKDYWQWDAGITAGKSWDNGSAWIAYSYAKTDSLYGRERDFIQNLDYSSQPYQLKDLTCNSSNLSVNTVLTAFDFTLSSVTYAAPSYVANTANRCDNTDGRTIVPASERHGVMAGLSQDLGDRTSIDVRAFYGQRKTTGYSDIAGSVTVTAANPYAATSLPAGLTLGLQPYTIFGSPVENKASVSFNLAPLLGPDAGVSLTNIKEWGANIELKHDVTENWQVRFLANWSQSDSRYYTNGINSARLTAAGTASTTQTAFNPFNVLNNDPALIRSLLDNESGGQAKDTLIQLRAIVEGKLFSLPGGDARLAFGYEFQHDKLTQRFGNDIAPGTFDSQPLSAYKRRVHSFFGELQLPVIDSLVLSAAARYDHYSDFGSTFNPKFGVTFKPVEGFTLRGNWGTSFTAPTPVDQLGSLRNTMGSAQATYFIKDGDTPLTGSYSVFITGSQPNLQPQTADTWSVGVDLEPTRGLRISGTYYDVNFKNVLSIPSPSSLIFTQFPNNIISNVAGLSPAQLRDFAMRAPNGSAIVEPLITAGNIVYEAIDFRTGNYGSLHVRGIDLSLNYRTETGFGSIDFANNWNIQLARQAKPSAFSAPVDALATETPQFSVQTSVGANIGNFRAQATWNHTGGYRIPNTTSVPVQDHLDAFNTVNLFFKYDVPSESRLLKNLSLTLNINNVFDQDPPVLRRNGQNEFGYANGFTLGRMFILGVAKQF